MFRPRARATSSTAIRPCRRQPEDLAPQRQSDDDGPAHGSLNRTSWFPAPRAPTRTRPISTAPSSPPARASSSRSSSTGAATGNRHVKVIPSPLTAKVTAPAVHRQGDQNDTGGLSNVASLAGNKIVLTSNSTKTGHGQQRLHRQHAGTDAGGSGGPGGRRPPRPSRASPRCRHHGHRRPAGDRRHVHAAAGFDNTLLTAGHGLRFTVTVDAWRRRSTPFRLRRTAKGHPGQHRVGHQHGGRRHGRGRFGRQGSRLTSTRPARQAASPCPAFSTSPRRCTSPPPRRRRSPAGSGFGDVAATTGVNSKAPSGQHRAGPVRRTRPSAPRSTVYNNSGEAIKLEPLLHEDERRGQTRGGGRRLRQPEGLDRHGGTLPYGPAGTPPLATANLSFDATKFTLKSIEADVGIERLGHGRPQASTSPRSAEPATSTSISATPRSSAATPSRWRRASTAIRPRSSRTFRSARTARSRPPSPPARPAPSSRCRSPWSTRRTR